MSSSLPPEDSVSIFRKSWTLYDAITERNYMFHRELYAQVADQLREVQRFGPFRILDLGCGNARFLAPCLAATPPVHYEGVDLSATALAEAREHLKGLPAVVFHQQEMLQALEGGDSTFEILFTGFAVHHLDAAAKQQLFHAAARRLHRGGRFLMMDVMRDEGQTREQYLHEYLGWMRANWIEIPKEQLEEACAHVAAYDFPEQLSDLLQMARVAGLRLDSTPLLSRFARHYLVCFSVGESRSGRSVEVGIRMPAAGKMPAPR